MWNVARETLASWVVRGLGAIIATLFVIWLIARMRTVSRNATARLEQRLRKRTQGLSFRSIELLSIEAVIRISRSILGLGRAVLTLVASYLWLVALVAALDRSRRAFDVVVGPLVAATSSVWLASVAFFPKLVTLVLIGLTARFASRVVRTLSNAIEEERLRIAGFEPSLAAPSRRLAITGIWLVALIFAAPYLPGQDSRAFHAISIVLAVLLSVGPTSVVSNLLSGLVLTYTRAYRVGDRVRINEVVGDVVSLGAFTTRLRTLKDEEVVVPNAVVQRGVVQNFSTYAFECGVQVHTHVAVGFNVPWRTVHRLLVAAARATDGVLESPQPYVLQRALDDFSVRYEICAFTDRPAALHLTEARLREAIQDEFSRERVEICAPHFRSLRNAPIPRPTRFDG